MPVYKYFETPSERIRAGIERRIAYLGNLMTAIIDFTDGPMQNPEPLHSHPHEQISYVAQGELYVFIRDEKYHLEAGDIFAVPPNVPHTVQTLTEHVRIIDSFSPIREEFIR